MSTTVYEDDASPQPSARLAAVCACLLMFVALVDSQVVGAITPQIAAGLNSAKTSVAASVMVYAMAAAAVALLLGRRAGRVRPVRWLPAAAGIFVAANALAAIAPHVALFWTARALAGLAGGLVSALVIAALADASTYARRGKQMSGVAVAYFLAPVVGVPLGAWLAGRIGWRAVFAASAALVAVAGLLVRQFPLSTSVETKGGEAAGESADDATRQEIDERRQQVDERAATAGQAATGGRMSSNDERASLWRLAMRSRSTRRGIVSAFFVSGGLVGLTTYLGTWLSDAFRAGTREVGLVYALAGAGAVAGGALGGMLADRYGKRRIAVASSALMILLLLVLPTFSWSARLWAVIGATAFLAALRVAPLQALVTELVAASERAAYIALRNGASQLGIALAVAVGARLYPRYGLAGVGAMCAALTVGAVISMRKLEDPHDVVHAKNKADDAAARVILETGESARPAIEADEAARPVADEGARPVVVEGAKPARRFSGRSMARKLAAVLVALALIVTFGLPWLLSFAITKAGTRPGERDRTDTPAAHGATFEPVTFTSTDGNTLSGWYLPARSGNGEGARRITFVLTHGLFRSRYEMLERGINLWREGYGVLLYDLRRHGRSAAEFSTIGYDERHDVRAAFEFVRGREPENHVVLMGVSMGAAATLLAASEIGDEKLLAVVAESSFLSFADTVRHHIKLTGLPTFPFATLLIKFTTWRLNFAASDYDLERAVRRISRPVLFIGGAKDVRMPNATVLEPLYAAAGSARKSKFIVEGATHGRAYDESPETYIKAVKEFVEAVE